jgi:hypothetical protein
MKSNEKENERIENGGRVRRRGGAAGDDECVPGASELGELAGGGEDDERDVGIAEHGELLRLLEQPPAALRERHLPRRRALYPPYLPRHLSLSRCSSAASPARTEKEEGKSTAARFTYEKSPRSAGRVHARVF